MSIIRDDKPFFKRHRVAFIGVAMLGGVVLAGFGIVLRMALIIAGVTVGLADTLVFIVGVLGLYLLVWWLTRGECRVRIAQRPIDAELRFTRYFLPVMALALCGLALHALDVIARGHAIILAVGGFCIVAVILSLTIVLGSGGLNKRYREAVSDEWIKAIRLKAAAIGFVAMTASVCTAFAVSCAFPALMLRALAVAICVGIAVPAFAYAFLEGVAKAEDEP